MGRGPLPPRWEIESTGGAGTLVQICGGVVREGGGSEHGESMTAMNTSWALTATTTKRSILSIRLRSANVRATLRPVDIAVTNDGNASIEWDARINSTLGASLTNWSNEGTISEFCEDQVAYSSGGYRIAGGDVPATNTSPGVQDALIKSNMPLGGDIDGTPDVLTVFVRASTGTQTVKVAITGLEVY